MFIWYEKRDRGLDMERYKNGTFLQKEAFPLILSKLSSTIIIDFDPTYTLKNSQLHYHK